MPPTIIDGSGSVFPKICLATPPKWMADKYPDICVRLQKMRGDLQEEVNETMNSYFPSMDALNRYLANREIYQLMEYKLKNNKDCRGRKASDGPTGKNRSFLIFIMFIIMFIPSV